jgi:glyoxylase-like metal-dependent hydrolase (beta-lactamase superfamily II)
LKIADGIEMIELKMNMMGRESVIYPTLIWDDDTVVLVDAGITCSLTKIKSVMKDAGVSFERIDKIIVTHQDIDHIGGIKCILDELPEVKVLAHEEEKPYIQGEKKFVRLNSGFMERINAFPEEEQEKILNMFQNAPVKVNTTLTDGEELVCCGGIRAIHTPGHTPGHICLYHKNSKTMIAGDAMNVIDGQLTGPNKQILNGEEVRTAVNSLKKFEKYDIETLISYHGGLFNDNPNQRIKELCGLKENL